MTDKKKKWVDFSSAGIQCVFCGSEASYLACKYHENTFPKLTSKNLIRIPNCKLCEIECQVCNKPVLRIPDYLHRVENSTKRTKKRLKKNKKEPQIKTSFKDKLDNSDFSEIRDIEIFRRAAEGILNTIFSFDIGTQLALENVSKKLENLELTINAGTMKSSNDRISRLLYTLLMIRSSGLSSYEKVIMDAEIERIYSATPTNKKDEIRQILKTYMEAQK